MRQNTPSKTPETPKTSKPRILETRNSGSKLLALIAAFKLALVGAGCGIFPEPGPGRRPEDKPFEPDVCESAQAPTAEITGMETLQGGAALRVDFEVSPFSEDCDSPTARMDGTILGAGGVVGRVRGLSPARGVRPGPGSAVTSFPPGLMEIIPVICSQTAGCRDGRAFSAPQ